MAKTNEKHFWSIFSLSTIRLWGNKSREINDWIKVNKIKEMGLIKERHLIIKTTTNGIKFEFWKKN